MLRQMNENWMFFNEKFTKSIKEEIASHSDKNDDNFVSSSRAISFHYESTYLFIKRLIDSSRIEKSIFLHLKRFCFQYERTKTRKLCLKVIRRDFLKVKTSKNDERDIFVQIFVTLTQLNFAAEK